MKREQKRLLVVLSEEKLLYSNSSFDLDTIDQGFFYVTSCAVHTGKEGKETSSSDAVRFK